MIDLLKNILAWVTFLYSEWVAIAMTLPQSHATWSYYQIAQALPGLAFAYLAQMVSTNADWVQHRRALFFFGGLLLIIIEVGLAVFFDVMGLVDRSHRF
jgi:hypothetical protein